MPGRREVDLVRPAREGRHECDPSFVTQHRPHAVPLAIDDVAVEAMSGLPHMTRFGCELALQDRRDEGIRVDLTVRVAQRDADLLAAVLEHEDVLHVGEPAQLIGPVTPHFDQVSDMVDTLLAERRGRMGASAFAQPWIARLTASAGVSTTSSPSTSQVSSANTARPSLFACAISLSVPHPRPIAITLSAAVTMRRLRPCPSPVGRETVRCGFAPSRSASDRRPTTVPPSPAAPSLAAADTPPYPPLITNT